MVLHGSTLEGVRARNALAHVAHHPTPLLIVDDDLKSARSLARLLKPITAEALREILKPPPH
jgi:hypothetical protein